MTPPRPAGGAGGRRRGVTVGRPAQVEPGDQVVNAAAEVRRRLRSVARVAGLRGQLEMRLVQAVRLVRRVARRLAAAGGGLLPVGLVLRAAAAGGERRLHGRAAALVLGGAARQAVAGRRRLRLRHLSGRRRLLAVHGEVVRLGELHRVTVRQAEPLVQLGHGTGWRPAQPVLLLQPAVRGRR